MSTRPSKSGQRISSGGRQELRIAAVSAALAIVAFAMSSCSFGSQGSWEATTSLESSASRAATAGSSYGSTDSSVSAALDASSTTTDDGPSQPKITDIKVGKGRLIVDEGRTVSINYTGWLYKTGKEFDSSSKYGHPLKFVVGTKKVILGLDNGIRGMKVGGIREIVVPSVFGYGQEVHGNIPAGSTLKFRVEVVSIE